MGAFNKNVWMWMLSEIIKFIGFSNRVEELEYEPKETLIYIYIYF
jgi:hypothetical protein